MSIKMQQTPRSAFAQPGAMTSPALGPAGGQSNSMLLDMMRDESTNSPALPAPFRIGEGKFGASVGTRGGVIPSTSGKTGTG